jgi:stringent starvation protein A
MTLLKRAPIELYSDPMGIDSHTVRIVSAEKGVSIDVRNVDANHPCEDLVELNPYNTLPTLVDRELVLYNSRVIMEYLDERFPHPPLLPVYPVARSRCRLMMYRIERDWYGLVHKILTAETDAAAAASAELKDSLVTLTQVFAETTYFLSEDYTLVDCVMAPLLWRLPALGVTLPRGTKAIQEYAERLFDREAFQASLSEAERELRETHDF